MCRDCPIRLGIAENGPVSLLEPLESNAATVLCPLRSGPRAARIDTRGGGVKRNFFFEVSVGLSAFPGAGSCVTQPVTSGDCREAANVPLVFFERGQILQRK